MKRLMIAALAVCIALPAYSQGQVCYPRDVVAERLADEFGETVQSRGLTADGAVVEMWANDETRTWTAVVTMPNGMACLVASGQHFERSDASPAPAGQDM